MADEIELKLTLPESVAGKRTAYTPAKIAAAFDLEQMRPASNRHLQNTYFDSEDEWLRRQGMALRIRRAGRYRIQTLKAPTTEVMGAQAYREFESQIADDVPNLDLVQDTDIQERCRDADLAARLQPAFTTDYRRATWEIALENAVIEMALDRGQIVVGDQQLPIQEVELELKQGDPAALFSFAETAVGRLPFRLGHQSKAARGYDLRAGHVAGPVKSSGFDLSEDCDVSEAFQSIAGHCLASLHANEMAVVQNEDPEGIHQFRVALRRFRSIVRAYRDLMDEVVYLQLSDDLRWLQQQFGPARDLDVFIAETLTAIHARFPDQDGVGHLLDTAKKRCREARHHAHTTLDQPRYVEIQLRLYRWLASRSWQRSSATASLSIRASDFADRLLKRQHKKLMRRGGDGRIAESELHELRVAGKKMRYLGDAFRSFYKSRPYKEYSDALSDIQDCLGVLNDAFVGQRLLPSLLDDLRAEGTLDNAQIELVRGIVLGWQASRIDGNLQQFHRIWKSFLKADHYWKKA